MQTTERTMAMDDQEVNEYLNKLLAGKTFPGSDLEKVALEKFKQATAEMAQAQNRLTSAQAEIDRLKAGIQQAIGQRNAYVNLLMQAEMARRATNRQQGMELESLKQVLGADKLEVVDAAERAKQLEKARGPEKRQ